MGGHLSVAGRGPTAGRFGPSFRARLEFAHAVAEGPQVWSHSGGPGAGGTPTFITLGLVGTLGTVVSVVAVVLTSDWLSSPAAAVLVSIGVMMLAAGTAFLPWMEVGAGISARAGTLKAVLRSTALCIVSAVWLSAAVPRLAMLSWPVGLLVGTEAVAVGRFIGRTEDSGSVARRYLLSPFHLGLATACVCLWLIGPERLSRPSLTAFISIETTWVTAALVHGVLAWTLRRDDQNREEYERTARQAEARHRAHWIHDDVCAEIRQLRLRMAGTDVTVPALAEELNDFESRIRERQLDEVIAGGEVSAAEVLQPYVRKAQSAGVRITAVPSFDQASIGLCEADATLLKRCVAGFVSNALAAGATTLGFSLSTTDGALRLEVSDDAGGFDLSSAPAGRGLTSLRNELGDGNLRAERRPDGTTMIAVLSLKETV